jgi:8-amino-7-oxononanoate synthase
MNANASDWRKNWEMQLAEIDAIGGRRRLRTFARSICSGGEFQLDGFDVVNFGSNDYLDLSRHPLLLASIETGVRDFGWGSGASPLVTGRSSLHEQLEQKLAEFEQAEAALLFSTGYAANMAAIVTLVGRGDGIFSDALNHASLIDGCRLSGAEVCRYSHACMDDLESQLACHRSRYERAIIVTDSLFSMDGDLAPIAKICDLAERFNCLVVVDEAHATGVYSENGAGWCHEADCAERVIVRTGTLSKAIGGIGGFVVGPQSFIDLLIHRGRSYMFSTSMPALSVLAALTSLELLQKMGAERQQLRQRAMRLRRTLTEMGLDVGKGDSPIVPVYVGDSHHCVEYAGRLLKMGCYVPAIRPPTVPVGKSLLRISLSIAHKEDDYSRLVAGFQKLQARTVPTSSAEESIYDGGS